MLLAMALLIIGLLLVVYGADRLVFSAAILCRSIGFSPLIIGMTVVSIGTSLPEIIIASAAALHGQLDLAVGTAIGSNITNIMLILGLAAVLHPLAIGSDILRRELPLMLLVSLVAGLFLFDGELSQIKGILLLVIAVLYLLFIIRMGRLAERTGNDKLTREQASELPQEGSLSVAFLWLGVALVIMPIATQMVTDNATVLAHYFGVSDLVVGLTIIAIGTSLPELATTIAGVRKGENDIAIGNIIGSNVFNLVFVLGIPALVAPGSFDPLAFARDYWLMLGVSAVFALLCWRKPRQVGKQIGTLLICGYIVWVVVLWCFAPPVVG